MKPSSAESFARLGLQMAGVGLWTWEPQTDVVSLDATASDLCGLEHVDGITLTMLGEHLPPEAVGRFQAAMHRSLLGAEGSEVSLGSEPRM